MTELHHLPLHAEAVACLCSDPDYCLRWATPEYRRFAIEYRRQHGATLPKDADPEEIR